MSEAANGKTPKQFIDALHFVFEHTKKRVKYKLGAKPDLSAAQRKALGNPANWSSDLLRGITHLDCSGFVFLWAIHAGLHDFPEGSFHQTLYAVQRWKRVSFEDILRYGVHDPEKLFICSFPPVKEGRTLRRGHIWLGCRTLAYESAGGKGVWERSIKTLRPTDAFLAGVPKQVGDAT